MVAIVISYWVGVMILAVAFAYNDLMAGLAVIGTGALFQSFALMLRRL